MNAPKVLFVEDNRPLAENMAELLAELGVQVAFASTAAEAREAIRADAPALAVVDVALPDDDGVSLLADLRAASSDTEAILVTGRGTLQSAMEAIRLGAFAYLLKPVDPDGFVTLASRALSAVAVRVERRKLARMLSVSEALHRTIVDSVDAAIVGLDREGSVVFLNQTSRDAFGSSLDVGLAFRRLFTDGSLVDKRVERCAGGETSPPWEAMHGRSQFRWTLSRVREENSVPLMVAVGVDVTERESLRRRAAEKEALAAIGVLTAGLAHEIRNPLNAAQLQLQLLIRRAKPGGDLASLRQRAEVVQIELRRLTKLLDDFLGLSRQAALVRRRFDLAADVRQILRLEAALCREVGVELRDEIDEELIVSGDEGQLHQVFLNLITNAREALTVAGGGTIRVGAKRVAGDVECFVADDGPGLGEGDVFEPFYTTKAAGTGLGLAIVRDIVRRHGGDIRLEGAPEGGVIAFFTLPDPLEPA